MPTSSRRRVCGHARLVLTLLIAAFLAVVLSPVPSFTAGGPPPPPPDEGPGGPILVVGSPSNPFGRYTAEILRAEGLNEFATADIGSVTATMLAGHDVVVLGQMTLTAAQVSMLTSWVTGGGNLIALRPDKQLAGLLGLSDAATTLSDAYLPDKQLAGLLGMSDAATTLSDAYLKVNTASGPGVGITGQTIQFHGVADRYTLNGATAVATLYANATTATRNPAVTLHSVGTNGGEAAAFTYDLSRSVVYTRQGNPAWAGQERDGHAPIRSDDLFFPDWIDLDKVAIPQADEQQRLLVNLIEQMNLDRKPLPRFWYLPRSAKAVVLATGDDHAGGGTAGRFDKYKASSSAGCVVANWECLRFTSYIYPDTPFSNAQAASYDADGFEVALHVNTDCDNWTPTTLENDYATQLRDWSQKYSSVPRPATNRTHCVAWSDWSTQADVELRHGIRLDTTYYYWPPEWNKNRPGFFTGSGMPMRFAKADGTMIDVYQAATQMTDESGQSYPFTPDTLLGRALGPLGYYGVFTANMHTDSASISEDDQLIASAKAHGVPVVSARQMLTWLDGRNSSSFRSIAWANNTLRFSVSAGTGATGLTGMVPTAAATGTLSGLSRDGSAVSFTRQTLKGMEYAVFQAAPGSYRATYSTGGGAAAATMARRCDCRAFRSGRE